MAGYKYYTILTDIGKEKLVEAIANETALDFTEIAVGDSNGTSYNPTPDMTALKHETYRATISSVSIDEVDKNIMIFEMVVPASSGGYYIREAGLFSSDGSLIAIARTAEQYKPLLEEGAGASITISMRIAISSEAQIYINVPESINYATQTYVAEEFKKHKEDSNPHEQYVLNETYSAKIDELQEDIDSKAASNHNHDSVYAKIGTVVLSDGSVKSNHIAANAITAAKIANKTITAAQVADNTFAAAGHSHIHNHDELYSKINHSHLDLAVNNVSQGGSNGSVESSGALGICINAGLTWTYNTSNGEFYINLATDNADVGATIVITPTKQIRIAYARK